VRIFAVRSGFLMRAPAAAPDGDTARYGAGGTIATGRQARTALVRRMRHDGCGGLLGKFGLLTGIEGV
jgi:hypothetical protein